MDVEKRVSYGRPNFLRMFLPFPGSGEEGEEKTFHVEHRIRCTETENRFGVMDDEEAIYAILTGKAVVQLKEITC